MICPGCNKPIPDDVTECPLCGESVSAGEAGSAATLDGAADADVIAADAIAQDGAEAEHPDSATEAGTEEKSEAAGGAAKTGREGDESSSETSSTSSGKSEPKSGEDVGPYSEGALKLMLEALRQPEDPRDHIPTIVVIGSTSVGKSFFLQQVIRHTQTSFQHRATKIDPGEIDAPDESKVMSESGSEPRERRVPPGDDLPITRNVFIHELTMATEGRKDKVIRLIDLPGEFFKAALDAKHKIAAVGLRRVAMLYAALATAEGVVFLIPSDHILTTDATSDDRRIARESAVLMGQIRQICNMMEVAVLRHREADEARISQGLAGSGVSDVEQAVDEIVRLPVDQILARMKRDGAGRSQKPVVALFSRADLCFGVGEDRSSAGLNGQLREHDPFWCAARYLPQLVGQLKAGFDDFKIDFVTAAEGHIGDTMLAEDAVSLGELKPIAWLLHRIEMRNRPLMPSRIPWILRKVLLLDIGRRYSDGSRWAVEMRESVDKEFGHHMKGARL
jgi:hypothetical protein